MYQQSAPIIHPKKFKRLMHQGDRWWDSSPDLAFSNYKQAADQGYDVAQYYLGLMYEEGRGVPKNREKAIEWYQKAAVQGHAAAQEKLNNLQKRQKSASSTSTVLVTPSSIHPTTEQLFEEALNYWESDPTKAVSCLEEAANRGHIQAKEQLKEVGIQYRLGIMYENGQGVPQNYAKAAEWYQKAANQGYAAAQSNLGYMYQIGRGVPQNEAKAVEWYQKAASQGNVDAQRNLEIIKQNNQAQAQYNVSKLFEEGMKYWNSDPATAFSYLQQAATQGHRDAQYTLGYMYQMGRGILQNDAKAAEWYQKAADQGNTDAQLKLGIMYQTGRGVPQNEAKAVEWYQKAASQGNVDAQRNLGVMYYGGTGVEQDYAKAMTLFRSLENSDMDSQFMLGLMYYNGHGIAKSDAKAAEYWQKAANQGHVMAKEQLLTLQQKKEVALPPKASSMKAFPTATSTSTLSPTVPNPQAKISTVKKEKQEEKIDKPEKSAKKESKGLFGLFKKKPKSETVEATKPTAPLASLPTPSPKPLSPVTNPSAPVAKAPASLPLPQVTKPIVTSSSHSKIDATGNVTLSIAIPFAELSFETELGRGAFGVVYQGAWHDSPVAIKTLLLQDMKQEVLDNFIQEASVMVALKHPNIIQLSGITLDHTPYCMVMEFMENGSLYRYLHSARPLDFPLQVQIAMDIARGLSYLHSKLILHRDLKSLNVLLDDRLRAKLADFGLSKVRHQTMSQTAGKMVGTPQWMAPELFDVEDDTSKGNEKSDMYSYGMVLWELLARRDPFAGTHDPIQIAMRVLQGKRETIPPETHPTFKQLIEKCWDKKAHQRPSAKDALDRLQPLQSQRGSLHGSSASDVEYAGNLASGQPASSSTSRVQTYTGNLASGQPAASNSQAKPGFFPPPPLGTYQGNLASGPRSTLPRPGKK